MQLKSSIKSTSGALLTGVSSYKFNSGWPFIQNLLSTAYEQIDEEQYFAMKLNGPATAQSIRDKVWCAVEGLGERVPVKLIEGPAREALLKSFNMSLEAARQPLRFYTLACNRRLSPATKVQLVYGKGVSTPSGVANSVEKRYNFQVREAFSATFNCERESAQTACLPIRPMRLNFNAPVPRKLAEAIRMKSGKDSGQAVFVFPATRWRGVTRQRLAHGLFRF